jgi:N-acetylneuraminic acid mutarotase
LRSWAVKCFTRQIPGLRERYQQISLYLAQVRLPFMVDFTFLEQVIRIQGAWYPILKMEWVEGLTLNQYVREHLHKPDKLAALAQIWVKLAHGLRQANIAHCDLQHGNVLLVRDRRAGSLTLKLVDYDGMCVPALTLLKSIELGHPAYQHPQRLREGIYSLEVDRFSNLVIYTALRALVVGGNGLWGKYDNGDNLLFKQADFEAPGKSAVFHELMQSPDPSVRFLTGQLIDAARKSLHQTPLLSDIGPGGDSGPANRSRQTAPSQVALVVAPVVAPAPGLPDFSQFVDEPDPKRRARVPASGRRITASLWVALSGAVALLGVLVGVVILGSMDGAKDSTPSPSKKGPLVVHRDGSADRGTKKETRRPRRDGSPNRDSNKGPAMDRRDGSAHQKPPEPLPPTWKSLASMPTARSLLAAVTGPDGRIYAIGGANVSGRLGIVDVYDPSTNRWAKAAPMPTARTHLAATLGSDKLIYAIGGLSGTGTNIVEAYNPRTNKWTTVAAMPTVRHGLAAVTGPDGRIYAIGGNGPAGSLNTVEAYNPSTNTWATVANMPTARVYLAAATGPDGRIYAIGGYQEGNGKRFNTVEAYDTKTKSWTTVASMPTARNALAAATGPDGRIYAIGGHTVGVMPNTVEAYNPSTNKWTTVARMPTVRGQLAAATGRDGRIYVIGGDNVGFLNTVEALSFSNSKS